MHPRMQPGWTRVTAAGCLAARPAEVGRSPGSGDPISGASAECCEFLAWTPCAEPARPAPPRAGRGKTAVPSRSPAAAAVALLCLRWHTFAGMDSAADIEVIDGGEEETVDSVAVAEANCDGGGRSADVHVGQKLA